MKKITLGLASAFTMLIIFSTSANAVPASVTASPPTRTIAINTPATIPLSWRVARTGAAGSVTVNSPSVIIRWDNGNGPIVYTINKTISKTQNVVASPEFFLFSEVISIPRDIVYGAAKGGHALSVERTFTDQSDATVNTGELLASISGSSGASFALTRIALEFDDGTTTCLANNGKPRTAIATFNATGTGVVHGAWQVRTGGGLDSFRTLRTAQVVIASGRETIAQSPTLPDIKPGDRLEVRFVVDSPAIDFPAPSITCGASGSLTKFQKPIKPENIAKLISPKPNSLLTPDTNIQWEALKGAKSYRVEILSNSKDEPITAQMVKKNKTSAKLSPLTLDKLNSKNRYTVRVIGE